jgi:hypothetical protein
MGADTVAHGFFHRAAVRDALFASLMGRGIALKMLQPYNDKAELAILSKIGSDANVGQDIF